MWLALVKGLVQLAHGIVGWLDDKQKMDAARAAALHEALGETVELVSYAKRVDMDTADLSFRARQRVRDALKRTIVE